MISVNPMTYEVTIPQADLTLVSGTLYELDVEDLRMWCHAWMDDQDGGITHPKMFTHYSEYTVVGVTYARAIIFLPPYSFTFEDGLYTVRLIGANNNLFDVENGILNQNYVQVISQNSAGLISNPDPGIAWDESVDDHRGSGTFGESVRKIQWKAK